VLELDVAAPRTGALAALRRWQPRQFVVAAAGAVAVALLIGVPTDVIPNPVFGRPVPVTWWSYPTLIVTAVLAGLLIGIAEGLTKAYQPEFVPWLGANFDLVVPYLIMIVVLMVRPYGMFGTKEVIRV